MNALRIIVDNDACPVRDEILKVAVRFDVPVVLVANRWTRLDHYLVTQIVVEDGLDRADQAIAEMALPSDIVITADIPLASAAVKKGALVIDPRGETLDEGTIGLKSAMRDLMTGLRETGEITGGPRGFQARDRQAFINALDRAVTRMKKQG